MRRYWIEPQQIHLTSQNPTAGTVEFKNDTFHHIFDVCRQEVGSQFEVLASDGHAYFVQVTEVGKKSAQAKIVESREIEKLPKPYINLALSLPRYHVMDSVIERAVEMGVHRIVPFVSDFSFIRKTNNLPAGKQERWSKIIVSATQQSGRGELMVVEPLCDWPQMLKRVNPNDQKWCLFAYEGDADSAVKPYIERKKAAQTNSLEEIWIIVGSEGGFSPQEVKEMHKLGLDPVTLGQQILRVETACLTLVSVLKYELGLWK